jgi:uncharacterized protein
VIGAWRSRRPGLVNLPAYALLMSPWIYYSLVALLVVGGVLCWLSNLLSLPGNWALVCLVALFWYFMPLAGSRGVNGTTVVILLALATVGEIIEFAAGAMGAAKHGASRRAVWLSLVGAMAGSIVGAVVGIPIPLVGSLIAALVGGSLGAFAGAYIGETWSLRSHGESVQVAMGAVKGRLWGTVGKFAVGGVMLGVATADALLV